MGEFAEKLRRGEAAAAEYMAAGPHGRTYTLTLTEGGGYITVTDSEPAPDRPVRALETPVAAEEGHHG